MHLYYIIVKKITKAPQSKLSKRKSNIVQSVLNMLDHPEAFITDLSTVGDFPCSPNKLKAWSKHLGFKIKETDYIVDVVLKYQDKQELSNVKITND